MTVRNIIIWQPYLFFPIYNHVCNPCLKESNFLVSYAAYSLKFNIIIRIIIGDLVQHFIECLSLWKALYMYATVKRCVLSFVLNFSKLISPPILSGNEFHKFGPKMLNDLLAKVCFLVCWIARTSFLFSNLSLGWFVFFSLALDFQDMITLFLCDICR